MSRRANEAARAGTTDEATPADRTGVTRAWKAID